VGEGKVDGGDVDIDIGNLAFCIRGKVSGAPLVLCRNIGYQTILAVVQSLMHIRTMSS